MCLTVCSRRRLRASTMASSSPTEPWMLRRPRSCERPAPSPERLDALGNRIGDVLLRDHADDVGWAPATLVFYDHRHGGLVSRHALNDVEHDVAFACDREF